MFIEIYLWADKYFDMPDEIKSLIQSGRKDKDTFIKELTKDLKKKLEK